MLAKSDPARGATVVYVALRAVDSLKVLFTPFLPHSSQRLHELLGYAGWIAGPLEFRSVTEEDDRSHQVLTGDYASWVGNWTSSELPSGQRLQEPEPLFPQARPGGRRRRARPGVIDTHAHFEPAEADSQARARAPPPGSSG